MNGYQRALTDRKQYDAPIPAELIAAELDKVSDYEARTLMKHSLQDATDEHGNVTLARVAGSVFSMEDAMRRETDRSLLEFGLHAKLGDDFLAQHLIRRANQLAASIKDGAKEMLDGAIG